MTHAAGGSIPSPLRASMQWISRCVLRISRQEKYSFIESVSNDLVPLEAGVVPLDYPVTVSYTISSETVCKLLSSFNVNRAICLDGIPTMRSVSNPYLGGFPFGMGVTMADLQVAGK